MTTKQKTAAISDDVHKAIDKHIFTLQNWSGDLNQLGGLFNAVYRYTEAGNESIDKGKLEEIDAIISAIHKVVKDMERDMDLTVNELCEV